MRRVEPRHRRSCRSIVDRVPVDIFLDTTRFHYDLRLHVVDHVLADRLLPFLGCNDLAVFKAFFNRRRDWADIEEMLRAGRLDLPYVTGVLAEYLGPGDERIHALHTSSRRDQSFGRFPSGEGPGGELDCGAASTTSRDRAHGGPAAPVRSRSGTPG